MAELERASSRFWDRKDIQGAQRVLDVWGTLKRHWSLGGHGVPVLDWIDMRDERFARIEKRGRTWIEEAKNPAFRIDGKLSPPFVMVLGVDAVLGEFENPPLLHGLLVHRYPLDGPLARTEHERSFRRYRPEAWVRATVGTLRGSYLERKLDGLLDQMERDFLEHLAFCGVRR